MQGWALASSLRLLVALNEVVVCDIVTIIRVLDNLDLGNRPSAVGASGTLATFFFEMHEDLKSDTQNSKVSVV